MLKFPLGTIVITPNALEALEKASRRPGEFINRHARGDWGKLDPEDWEANEWSLQNGARLMSSYPFGNNQKLWIITEADRSVTTLLLPEDY